MLNQITLEDKLDELLAKYPSLIEIYATLDYTLGDPGATLFVLHNYDRYDFTLYLAINEIMPCKLVFITDVFDARLQDKRIIWRKGKWYV